ncbi:hypothetical protein CEE36_03705 [candidate division TA06 bacterium B3_TA06]|uniref:HTH cro/C1-type domain-containing protein n=1 Tax=candidate division TA06 bacterium B3_TA06 TaxID=2012487 RepID=A0A532V8D4_UNCT6|nr:MAG: hypothetical protein CEE36_03705 [candidate division TA06 bacterium B3_TA06]
MIDKEELEAQLEQDYKELLEDVEYHIEGLKAEFAEEVSKYLGKGEGKITRAELARMMGTSPAWITKMLRTNWNMTMETMAKLAFALGMKIAPPKFVPIAASLAQRKEKQPCTYLSVRDSDEIWNIPLSATRPRVPQTAREAFSDDSWFRKRYKTPPEMVAEAM